MKIIFKLIIIVLFLAGAAAGTWWWFLGPVENKSAPVVFTIAKKATATEVALKLKDQNLIKDSGAFSLLFNKFSKDKEVLAGGYRLDKNMNSWQVLQKITSAPDLVWVSVPEGWRKEQIGEALVQALGWSKEEENKWNNIYTTGKPEYVEGVYFPDTYLIPKDESGREVAQRFINRFNEKFAPYLDKFTRKNIRWTTGLKIASLIQREAGGSADMPIISGIIWNRLDKGMKLEIDATMQYTRGKNPSASSGQAGWWGAVDLAEKKTDSPFNTYLYKGLPPRPICNPGLEAIEAALNPAGTDCLFYLHDADGQIHCAKTYQEHKENISKYL